MNELVSVNSNGVQPTVSGRDLHKFLEIDTRYTDWFARMVEYGFVKGVDFNLLNFEKVRLEGSREVKRSTIDHEVTIPMAKEISMIQRNDKGKEARQYFIKVEEAWNTPEMVMARALQVAKQTIGNLQQQTELLMQTVTQQAPLVEIGKAIEQSDGSYQIGHIAAVLNIKGLGRNNMFKYLKQQGILQHNNKPYQKYLDQDVAEFTMMDTPVGQVFVPLLTGKGVVKLVKLLQRDGRLPNTTVEEIMQQLKGAN